MLLTVAFFIFVQLTLFIPGFALVRASKIVRRNTSLEICLAYLCTTLFLGVTALLGYVLDISLIAQRLFLVGVLGIGFVYFFQQRLYQPLVRYRFAFVCLLAMSFFSILFIKLTLNPPYHYIPDPQPIAGYTYTSFDDKVLGVAQTNANDNSIPYRQAQFIVNRSDPAHDSFIDEWGVGFFQRTPLMGAITASYLTILNERPPIGFVWSPDSPDIHNTYIKFQTIAAVLNAIFIIPALFLLTKLFNRKSAQIALLLMVPSQYYLYNSFFTWPKSFVAFFVLLSWLLILKKRFRYLVLAGVASGAAYMTHDLAVLYLGASILLLLYRRRFRDTFVFLAVTIVFMIPWLIASTIVYKKPSTFVYYPVSIHGIPQYEHRKEIIKEFMRTPLTRLISIRLESLFYLLSPYQLIYSEGGQAIGRRVWAAGLYSIPGAVGFGAMFATLAGLIKRIRDVPFLIMAFVPVLACIVVIGWPRGLGATHFAEASVALFVGLGSWYLSRLRHKIWLLLAYVANTAQLIFFTLYSYNFMWRQWLHSFHDITILVGLVTIVVGCGFGIRIASLRPNHT